MAKLKSISTSIWADTWFEELTISEKLLFVYLIANEKNNMLGIYEISLRKISFETGLKRETITKAFESFERVNKVRYMNNYIILVNYLKYQNYNTNMKISAIDVYNSLPNELKISEELNEIERTVNGFVILSNGLGMVRKIEVEHEEELEEEKEINIAFDLFWNLYDKKVGDKKTLSKKWENLKDKDRIEIIDYIPKYKLSQPDKKYRKDPATFFNQKSWNDEIIIQDNGSKSGLPIERQKEIDEYFENYNG